jgi:hypothetical protein
VIEPAAVGLTAHTYFRFWWSGDIALSALVQIGRFKGRLDAKRRVEIIAAVEASKLVALKRLS